MNAPLDLDVVRLCSLRWPMSSELDRVAVEKNPLLRCVIVARAITDFQKDAQLGPQASLAIETLRNEARRRHSGTAPAIPPLVRQQPTLNPTASKERPLA